MALGQSNTDLLTAGECSYTRRPLLLGLHVAMVESTGGPKDFLIHVLGPLMVRGQLISSPKFIKTTK